MADEINIRIPTIQHVQAEMVRDNWKVIKNKFKNIEAKDTLTSTVTSNSNTILNTESTGVQEFTGTNNQTITLPDTSDLLAGKSFKVINNSTGVITLKDFSNTVLITLATNENAIVTCLSSSSQSWEVEQLSHNNDLTEQTFVGLVEAQSGLITAPDSNFILAVIDPVTHDLFQVPYSKIGQFTAYAPLTYNQNLRTLTFNGTKNDVGLGNVDNTADIDKPIPTAVQNALDDKLDASAYQQHFLGNYTTVLALETAHPTASAGDYALVDAGNGQDAILYIWDNSDTAWIPSGSAVLSTTDALPEGNTNFYFTDIRAIKAVPYDWECTSEGTTPFLVTTLSLPSGDYNAPNANIGCANILHTATIELRKASDNNSLVTSISYTGGLSWQTGASGFVLVSSTTINVYLKTDNINGIGFLDGFKFN